MRQPNQSPWPLSQLFSQKSEGIFYIWAVYISDLLVIARYFKSFTLNKRLVMRSLLFFFFSFFFSLFDVWVFASDLTVSTRGDGFSTYDDESLLLCFFFFVWCLGKHMIWFIETCDYGFSTHGEPMLLCFCFFFFFFVWCLGKHLIWSIENSGHGFFFFFLNNLWNKGLHSVRNVW